VQLFCAVPSGIVVCCERSCALYGPVHPAASQHGHASFTFSLYVLRREDWQYWWRTFCFSNVSPWRYPSVPQSTQAYFLITDNSKCEQR
jgi:hypothetical protein